jgi:DNA processing protein
MPQILDWLALSLAPGLGITGYWRLVNSFGSPGEVLAASTKDLLATTGIRAGQVAGLADTALLYEKAEQELVKLARFGAKAVSYDQASYPELLGQTEDPPPVLYIDGREDLLNRSCLAMVGSRAATEYGRRVAFVLAEQLAVAKISVVSGLAMGIDARAHEGALAAGGDTVAVLGCGLDIIYPSQNRYLFDKIREGGVLVSEYSLGTRPEGFRFPARNRIIAGMSQGVVVVEAAQKSGSLITAQLALDWGREVFAVPGRVDSFKSAGTHWLLKQGAKLVQTVEDILEEIQTDFSGASADQCISDAAVAPPQDPDTLALLACLDVYPCSRDDLILRSGLAAGRVNEILLFLELDGFVEILSTDEIQRLV